MLSVSERRKVRDLNDAFRQTFTGGRVMLSAGVASLPEQQMARLLEQVRRFDKFNADNDPHSEHDFGTIEQDGESYFFKIDYYIPDLRSGSEYPADDFKTTRVLTIMRADEY